MFHYCHKEKGEKQIFSQQMLCNLNMYQANSSCSDPENFKSVKELQFVILKSHTKGIRSDGVVLNRPCPSRWTAQGKEEGMGD